MSYTRTTEGLRDAAEYGYGPAGPHAFDARAHVESPRAQLLARRAAYFRNRQHDDKGVTWDNRSCPPFQPGHTPLMSSGAGLAEMPYYTPLYQRRPGAPYRMPRMIVRGFTNLIFGEGRFPIVKVRGDAKAEDWLKAVVEAARIPERIKHARDVGGAEGTVALSWRFWEGTPRVGVHPGSSVVVQEWADREEQVVAVATELLQYVRPEWDEKEQAFFPVHYWRRRDWTPIADVVFVDLRVGSREEREAGWVIDAAETVVHGEGEAHLVWVQNAAGYDASTEDGDPDYEGLLEDCDAADLVLSVLAHGGARNLDPTLVLKLNPQIAKRIGELRKGSDNAVNVGPDGDASYLELSGASISAGIELLNRIRQAVLECSQFVAHDPEKIAAATSGAALKLLYHPMISVGNDLRGTYGRALKLLLGQMLRSARRHLHPEAPPEVSEPQPWEAAEEPSGSFLTSEGGEPEAPAEAQEGAAPEPAEGAPAPYLKLPPKLVEEPALGADGQPVPGGEKVQRWEELDPGEGGEVDLVWPDWFEQTPAERQAQLTALSAAAGGAAVLPRELATRLAARAVGEDEDEAWRLMAAQIERERDAQAGMFPPAGLPAEKGTTTGDDATEQAREVGQDVEVVPEAVLNGAQVQAALAIVTAVSDGTVPRDAALGQLEVLFNLQPGQALKILGSVGEGPPQRRPVPTPEV